MEGGGTEEGGMDEGRAGEEGRRVLNFDSVNIQFW